MVLCLVTGLLCFVGVCVCVSGLLCVGVTSGTLVPIVPVGTLVPTGMLDPSGTLVPADRSGLVWRIARSGPERSSRRIDPFPFSKSQSAFLNRYF